jgi:hypothetical protein
VTTTLFIAEEILFIYEQSMHPLARNLRAPLEWIGHKIV